MQIQMHALLSFRFFGVFLLCRRRTTFSLFTVQLPVFVATLIFQNTVLIVLYPSAPLPSSSLLMQVVHCISGAPCFHNVTITVGSRGQFGGSPIRKTTGGKSNLHLNIEGDTAQTCHFFDGKSLQRAVGRVFPPSCQGSFAKFQIPKCGKAMKAVN